MHDPGQASLGVFLSQIIERKWYVALERNVEIAGHKMTKYLLNQKVSCYVYWAKFDPSVRRIPNKGSLTIADFCYRIFSNSWIDGEGQNQLFNQVHFTWQLWKFPLQCCPLRVYSTFSAICLHDWTHTRGLQILWAEILWRNPGNTSVHFHKYLNMNNFGKCPRSSEEVRFKPR